MWRKQIIRCAATKRDAHPSGEDPECHKTQTVPVNNEKGGVFVAILFVCSWMYSCKSRFNLFSWQHALTGAAAKPEHRLMTSSRYRGQTGTVGVPAHPPCPIRYIVGFCSPRRAIVNCNLATDAASCHINCGACGCKWGIELQGRLGHFIQQSQALMMHNVSESKWRIPGLPGPVNVVQSLHLTDMTSTIWQSSHVVYLVKEEESPSLVVSPVLLVKCSGQPTDFFFFYITFSYSKKQLNEHLLAADTQAAQCCDWGETAPWLGAKSIFRAVVVVI